jgi:penicillin V acylase-like amidase (Ntn superfamily)
VTFKTLAFALAVSAPLLHAPLSVACTALMITDLRGNAYSGKTMEFAGLLPFEMTYVPAGTPVTSKAPDGRPGLSFATRYPVLGVSANLRDGSRLNTMVEAANDRGLSMTTNEMPGSRSPDLPAPAGTQFLSTNELGLYLLGNFSSVAEVKEALQGGKVRVWLPGVSLMGNIAAPFHYILFDRSGEGIVIEYLDGKQTIHDNPVGVATNAPDFGWHLKNLDNYAHLSNRDRNRGQFNRLAVTAPDSGNALDGVPSTQISAGRFVKAAYYTQFVRKAATPEAAVVTLGHILNNFDRPYDLSTDQGFVAEGGSPTGISSEVTLFTWMNDKSRNLYFPRTIDSLNFATFAIDTLAPVTKVVSIPLAEINDSRLDGTQVLLDAAKR